MFPLFHVNQLVDVSQAVSKLSVFDARLLRRIAHDVIANINTIEKWSKISSLTVAFAKLKLGHPGAWKVLCSWINANFKDAKVSDLSFAVSSCAVCNISDTIRPAAEHLAANVDVSEAPSAFVWLNTVYAIAVCRALIPKLAETVLRQEFIDQVLTNADLAKRVFLVSRIAQIQSTVECKFGDGYHGPHIKLKALLPPNKEMQKQALINQYGKIGAFDAEFFHSVLYKIAPVGTHAVEPGLTADGIFVNAIVKLDEKRHFVPVNAFTSHPSAPLAIVYLIRKHFVTTCEEEEPTRLLGSVDFGLRILRARGMEPVLFTETDMKSAKLLTQKIDVIKKKLYAASDVHGDLSIPT
ncbi:hypothetical protein AB6A40_006045 [Gnathostoma spinigerum]|uniref:Uncharacterized protein n=1 Tax=Gnathostoma spinigerum TaxID=75299 RepID=A0ABD6EJB0_9BILA